MEMRAGRIAGLAAIANEITSAYGLTLSDEWNRLFERGIKAILRGKETAHSVMEKIVSRATGDVQKTI